MEAKELKDIIIKALDDKKGEDITVIDVKEKTTITEYMVIASARSSTHVRSLCESVTEAVETAGGKALREEGVREGRWAVIDFGDVILHVFDDSSRDFYHLERLWGDGERISNT